MRAGRQEVSEGLDTFIGNLKERESQHCAAALVVPAPFFLVNLDFNIAGCCAGGTESSLHSPISIQFIHFDNQRAGFLILRMNYKPGTEAAVIVITRQQTQAGQDG